MKKLHLDFKQIKIFSFIIVISMFTCNTASVIEDSPFPFVEGSVRIAKWKNDKKASLSLQFDDSTPGQATIGIPAMNKRKLVGTWYINPGTDYYSYNKNYWEKIGPEGGQELANHTMNHTGATDAEGIEYEVGEAARIIWHIRGDDDFGSLIAFNQGGGTNWNEDILKQMIVKYHLIDRVTAFIGEKNEGVSIPSGSNSDKMYERIPACIEDSSWLSLFFHGICEKNGSPPMDFGNAGVWIVEFENFLDKVVAKKDNLWIAGFIQVYKYIKERQTTTATIKQYSNEKYTVELISEMDNKYYNEPLTIVVNIPKDWQNCRIVYKNTDYNYQVNNGVLMFDALPNSGIIEILKN